MADPIITKIETHTYEYERENLGKDYNGFNIVYEPGNRMKSQGNILRIETDQGIVGEYAGGGGAEFSTIPTFAHFLIGRSALQRELIYTEVRRALRQVARIGLCAHRHRPLGHRRQALRPAYLQTAGRLQGQHPLLRQHLPRRPPARRPLFARSLRRFRRTVPRVGLSGLQNPRLGPRACQPGSGQCPRRRQTGRRQNGPDARSRLRADDLR